MKKFDDEYKNINNMEQITETQLDLIGQFDKKNQTYIDFYLIYLKLKKKNIPINLIIENNIIIIEILNKKVKKQILTKIKNMNIPVAEGLDKYRIFFKILD